MKKSKENSNQKHFLNTSVKGNISDRHKAFLGTTLPEDYFAKSKSSILNKIKEEPQIEQPKKPKKKLVFWMQPQFKYIAAASLTIMLSLTVWLQNSGNSEDIQENNFEQLALTDDVLVSSLFLDDTEIDAFAETVLFNEVLVKAELSEQNLDNLILNSLIIEDSLLEDYMDDKLIETIIL